MTPTKWLSRGSRSVAGRVLQWTSTQTPTGRAVLGLALVGVAAVVVSGFLVQGISSAVDEIQKRHSPALESILRIRGDLGDGVRAGVAYLVTRDAAQRRLCLDTLGALHATLDRFAQVARIEQQGEEQERALLLRIRTQHGAIEHRARALLAGFDQTGRIDVDMLRRYEQACGRTFAAIDSLVKLEHDEVQRVHSLALRTIAQARLGLWAVAATVVVLAFVVGVVLRRAFLEAEQALAEQRALRDRFVERTIAVQDGERRRVARELHDETGQALTSLAVGLRGLSDPGLLQHPESVADTAARLQRTTEQLVQGINRLVHGLHPQVIEGHGWVAAVEQLLAEFRAAHGIAVDLDLVGLARDVHLPSGRALAVYRVVQEALTNVARYANARHVGICLWRQARQMRVMIEDDGCGFDLQATRAAAIGLHGMRERAASLGGQLTLESTPRRGTTVVLDFPLDAPQPDTSVDGQE